MYNVSTIYEKGDKTVSRKFIIFVSNGIKSAAAEAKRLPAQRNYQLLNRYKGDYIMKLIGKKLKAMTPLIKEEVLGKFLTEQ